MPEFSLFSLFYQIFVGSLIMRVIDRDYLIAADTHNLFFLNDSNRRACNDFRDITDFIEKNCPPVSEFKESCLPSFLAPVKPRPHNRMLTFKQVIGYGPHSLQQQKVLIPPAGIMNALREQFLARTGFALYEH